MSESRNLVLQGREEALIYFGFPKDANPTLDELKNVYKIKALTTHPDKGGSNELFVYTKDCFDLLINESPISDTENNNSDTKSEFNNSYTENNNSYTNWQTKHKTKYTNPNIEIIKNELSKFSIGFPKQNDYPDGLNKWKVVFLFIVKNEKIKNCINAGIQEDIAIPISSFLSIIWNWISDWNNPGEIHQAYYRCASAVSSLGYPVRPISSYFKSSTITGMENIRSGKIHNTFYEIKNRRANSTYYQNETLNMVSMEDDLNIIIQYLIETDKEFKLLWRPINS